MRPVWEVLHPYPEVEAGKVTEDSFVVSIGGIWERLEHGFKVEIDERYLDPEGFYRRTHFTDAMRELLLEVTARLGGGQAQSVHHLQVGMGGGKSHTLLLLYYLAKYKDRAMPYLKREGIADDVPPFRVAVLDGMRLSPTFGKQFPDGSKVLTLWGLLFKQLGVYDRFKEADRWNEGPDVSMLKEALSWGPTLILIDEITFFIANLSSRERLTNRVQAFLQALTAAVKESPGCAMVVTTPIGVYPEGLKLVSTILARYCTPTILAAGKEYKNIRKRALYTDDFESISPEVEATAREYEATLKQHLPERAATVVDSIVDNYPFHPFVDRTLQRLKDHRAFQEVRDELRFLAGLIYSVHQKRSVEASLISVGHADLEDQYVRGGTISKLQDPIVVNRLDTDLEERLQEIPESVRETAKQVLAVIVLNSISPGSPLEKGISRDDAIYALLTPETTPPMIDEALKQIVRHLWFVNPLGDRYVFGQPNLSKLINDYVRKVELDQSLKGQWWDIIKDELRAWKNDAVKQYVRKAGEKGDSPLFKSEDIFVWANRGDEVPDDKTIKLVLTDYIIPEANGSGDGRPAKSGNASSMRLRVATSGSEACDAVKDIYESYGSTPRNYKNTVFFLVAGRGLVERNGPVGYAKQLLALREMLVDREQLHALIGETGLSNIERLNADTIKDLRPSCVAAYQYLVYPSSGGLSAIQLGEERRAVGQLLSLIEERLDTQVKKILRGMTSEALLDRYWPRGRSKVEMKALVEGFFRRPEIEVITDRKVVEDAVREALRKGDLAYMMHDEVFYNREPVLIEDNGVLVKDPDVVTVSVESIDDKGDSLPVQLLIDGRKLVSTPLSLQDLKGVEHTVQPTTPSEHEFVGWRDGHTTEERTIGWDQSQTLVLEYKREEITVYDVELEIKAVDVKTNTELNVAVLVNGESKQTPIKESFPMGKRCEVSIGTPLGMTFTGWSDGSRNLERTITCDYSKVITATYNPVTPEVDVVNWSGPIREGVQKLQEIMDGSAKHLVFELDVSYEALSKSIGAVLQLVSQPYTIDVEASGGQALGLEKLSVSVTAGSDKRSGVRSFLTQMKNYLEEAKMTLTKDEGEYKPLKELLKGEALQAIEKMDGTLSYEIHMLTDPTRKPEPKRSLKGLIDDFKRVG